MTSWARHRLIQLCRRDVPREACGLIAGTMRMGVPGVAHFPRPVHNIHADPVTYFEMDPSEQLREWAWIEDRGLHVIGFYHSHVDTPAEPSGTDLRMAPPGLLSVIVSLAKPEADVRVWSGPIPYEGDIFE